MYQFLCHKIWQFTSRWRGIPRIAVISLIKYFKEDRLAFAFSLHQSDRKNRAIFQIKVPKYICRVHTKYSTASQFPLAILKPRYLFMLIWAIKELAISRKIIDFFFPWSSLKRFRSLWNATQVIFFRIAKKTYRLLWFFCRPSVIDMHPLQVAMLKIEELIRVWEKQL